MSDKPVRSRIAICAFIPLFLCIDSLLDARLWTLLGLLSCGTLICVRHCRESRQAWMPIVFWITFAWLYRVVNVGITYDPGDVVSDLHTLARSPIVDSYFPRPLGNPYVYAAMHIIIPTLGLITLAAGNRGCRRLFAGVAVVLSFAASLHQYGMANQMMVTTLWSAAYLSWLEWHDLDEPQRVAVVGQMIVSFIFFGAFLGKLTPEYWSSSVTARLGQTPLLPSNILTQGRMAVVVEGIASVSFLLRPDLAAGLGLFVVAGMLASVSPSVIDATGPVVGICMASLVLVNPLPPVPASVS